MIPRLYERDETLFRHNGIALLDETLYCHAREVRNGAFDLELEYPNNGRWFKELKEFRFIVAKTNDIWNEHIFRIYDIEKSLENHSVIVRATSKSNDLNGNVITPVDIVNKNAQQALDIMKANIVHPTNYVFNSDITTVASTSWLAQNPLKCLGGSEGSIIDIWGGEIQRGNSTINVYARRGRDNVTTIRPGKGLQGFRMTTSTKGLITQVLPAVTYNNPNTGLDVTHYGTPINSPKIGNYPIVYTEIVDYSSHEGVMPEETIHVPSPEHPGPQIPEGQLSGREFRLKAERNATNAARSYFTEQNPDCDIPKVTMEVDMMRIQDSSEYWYYKDLETLELTDTLTVWIEKFDIDVLVKVTELVYNVLDETVISIVAGSSKGGIYRDTSQRFDDVSNEIHNIKEEKKRGDKHYNQVLGEARNYFDAELEALETVVRKGADGKNSIFTGRLEPDPTLPVENDIWYKILADESVEMYRHNGTAWELILTSADSISSGTIDALVVDVKNIDAFEINRGILDAGEAGITIKDIDASKITRGELDAGEAGITIKDIDASKITRGELDAGEAGIVVKNLDASRITRGEIDAAETGIQIKNIDASQITRGILDASAAGIEIKDIDASKITRGELDAGAAGVVVKNLDASRINRGVIDFGPTSPVVVENIDAAKINRGTLDGDIVTIDNIDADHLTKGSIDADLINVNNIKAGNITSGTLNSVIVDAIQLTAEQIISGTIDASLINVKNIKADNITSGTLNSTIVDALELAADQITSGVIDAALVNVVNLNAGNIVTGTLKAEIVEAMVFTAEQIVSGTIDASLITVKNLDAGNISTGTLKAEIVNAIELTAEQIVSGAIDASLINVKNIKAGNITSGTFTTDVLDAIRISASQLTAGTIDASLINVKNIKAGNISTGTLKAEIVNAIQLSADQLTAGTIDASLITVKNLDAGNISTGTLKASIVNAIELTAEQIVSGTIDASLITVKNLDAGNISTGTLKASIVNAMSFTAEQIISGTIDAGAIAVTNIEATNIKSGTLDAGLITVKNLSASAINTGTLNASLINLINLNANSITTGTISGTDGFWNLNTGTFRLGAADGRFSTTDREGFEVTENNETLAAFGAAGAVVPVLHSNEIYSDNIAYLHNVSGTYTVGPGRTYADITDALDDLFGMGSDNPKLVGANHKDIILKVYGVIYDSPHIAGLSGKGHLIIEFTSTAVMHGAISIQNNQHTISIQGTGRIVSTGAYNVITVFNSGVSIESIKIDGTKSTIGITARYNSMVFVNGVDIIGSSYFGYADWGATISFVDNRGRCGNSYYAQRGGIIRVRGNRPIGSSPSAGTKGFMIDSGSTTMDSGFSPAPVTKQTFKKVFTSATFDTLANGTSVNSYFGAAAAQNKWTSGMSSWQQGRIRMGSAIRDFYSGGSNIKVWIRLRRKNSTHGTSLAVAPTPSNFTASMSAATRGGWTGWGTISYGSFGTSVDLRLGSNTYSNYAIWDAVQVEVWVDKNV